MSISNASEKKVSNNVLDENALTLPLMPKTNSNTGPDAKVSPTRVPSPEEFYQNLPLTDETTCGIGCIKGAALQKFANKKVYVFIYGLLGSIFGASYAYGNGIITTLEKRFKIPSKTIGLIAVGNDITQLFVSLLLTYYAGKGHRPRWIAFGLYTVVAYCLLTALPHLLYGPGQDALTFTLEHGAVFDANSSLEMREKEALKLTCGHGEECDPQEGNMAPVLILILAQLVSGVGGSLYYTIGVSYMDDNVKKEKTPALISIAFFLRLLGPSFGYALASICLKMYISPTLTPTIDDKDPRWLGAWWLGYIVWAGMLFVFASLLGLFPKELPRAAARRIANQEQEDEKKKPESTQSPSLKDMIATYKRLLANPTLTCNNAASVFYFFGYMPYWIYMPKYIETQYRQSPSTSSFITGTVGLVFSAIGILLSGLIITKFRPRARYMALWNVLVGFISVLGIVSYCFLGCPDNDSYGGLILPSGELKTDFECNKNCECEYVRYSPVCSNDGYTTYISACHAGCRGYLYLEDRTKVYTNCSCIPPLSNNSYSPLTTSLPLEFGSETFTDGGFAVQGACPFDCNNMFYIFLAVVCLLKFSGATGRATNFLVSVRCVDEEDKPAAMGLGVTIMSLFSFIPSPIFFGYLLDATCLVWGKTCSGTGNCWLYDGESLRYLLNLTAAGFVTIGTLFDAGVWYYVKDLEIFNDTDGGSQNKKPKGSSESNNSPQLKHGNNYHVVEGQQNE